MYFPLLLMLLSTPSQAAPSCAELEREWRSTYTRDINIHWDLKGFICPGDESVLALAFHDLQFIDLEPNSDGYSPPFYAWVKNAFKDVYYNKECTYLASAAGSHMTVCPPVLPPEPVECGGNGDSRASPHRIRRSRPRQLQGRPERRRQEGMR